MAYIFMEQITKTSQKFCGWIKILSYIKYNRKFMFDNLTEPT